LEWTFNGLPSATTDMHPHQIAQVLKFHQTIRVQVCMTKWKHSTLKEWNSQNIICFPVKCTQEGKFSNFWEKAPVRWRNLVSTVTAHPPAYKLLGVLKLEGTPGKRQTMPSKWRGHQLHLEKEGTYNRVPIVSTQLFSAPPQTRVCNSTDPGMLF
jgi:hypothetical protein